MSWDNIDKGIEQFSSMVWGLPLILLLIGGGIYLVILSKGIVYRYGFHAIQVLRGKYDNPDEVGEISHFKALSTALASTIGMGNIAGVAVAIHIGGPGAIFWMWMCGLLGMSTKFFECALAIMYRGMDSEGKVQGGPMYFIIHGLGAQWRPMAVVFAVAGLVGSLPVFNVNQLTQAIQLIVLEPAGVANSFSTNLWIGVGLFGITAVVILGGLSRIATVSSYLVPFMVAIYFVCVCVILGLNVDRVPEYFGLIFSEAFAADRFNGEAFLGGSLGGLILLGVRRAAFSNEAGIGTAPMAHGAAKTDEPIREGLVAMLGPFIDTIVVCTLTALSILVTDTWLTSDANGVSLTTAAFSAALGPIGKYLLLLCICVFSISSLFSFSYYGTKCTNFLFGANRQHIYNYFYLVSILLGAVASLSAMINLIDGCYGLMAFPTMTATLLLAPKVVARARVYFEELSIRK